MTTNVAGIPAWMKAHDRWCVWRVVTRGGKPTKKPINARTGGGAMPNADSTWCSFAEAVQAMRADATLAGLGFMLGDGIIGVDVDDCFDWIDGWSPLARETLHAVAGYAERSPSGSGLKIITRGTIPASRNDRKLGLEVYDRFRFFAVTGDAISVTGEALECGDDAEPEPIDLTEFCVKHFGPMAAPALEDGDISALVHAKGPLAGFDLETVRELLEELDPSELSYEEWLTVGQALHHQGEAGDDWMALWDEWSERDASPDRYSPGVCEEKWETFGNPMGRAALTILTVKSWVNAKRAAKQYDRREFYGKQIEAATLPIQLETDLPRIIAKDLSLDTKAREALAQQLKRRIKALHGIAYPISDVRGWVRATVAADDAHMPDWLKPYVYVGDEDRFFDCDRKMRLTRATFNMSHNRHMPKGDNGNPVMSAADGAQDMYQIPVVDSALYQPALDRFFVFNGRECVNTYDPASTPDVPAVLLDAEEAAVELVREHLQRWTANEREFYLLLSWLAYVVQNPGKKVRWAPYLCGVQGDGKSFFGEMLGAVMGASNYRSMSGELINGSPFTDWAVGQCVTMIEEVKLHGANRFEAANKIKPFITNETVDVHPKGRPAYNAPNTVNYLIASNFLDGMPISDDDRRFMFLQSAYSTASLKAFRAKNPHFYKRLFDSIYTYPGAIRHWLLKFSEWHRDFEPDGNAPHTAMRADVVEMSLTDTEAACRTVFESGTGGVTDTWVAVKLFSLAVERELGPRNMKSSAAIGAACAQFLRERGFRSMGKTRPRVGPERVQSAFWCHESLSNHFSEDSLNWWPEAEKAMEKSFADATKQDFLN